MQYAENFVLSAIAPETMVAVVAQKTRLNTKVDAAVKSPLEGLAMKSLKWVNRSIFGRPINPNRESSPIMMV